MGKPLLRKLVVLGDGGCGKTSLLTVFTKGSFPTNYEPTVFENYVETIDINGQEVELSLWDTAGQEDFDRLRSLSYADTGAYSLVDDPVSMENIQTKWIREVERHCPGVKVALVALKCDLRGYDAGSTRSGTRRESPISYDQGLELARDIKASCYLECSAKQNRGVQEAIYEAAVVSLATKPRGGGHRERPWQRCTIL